MDSLSCFMCGQIADNVHFISDTRSGQELCISNIICQHFWFQEEVLRTAIICEPCWQTVDQFHRYYQDVKQYHDQLSEPNSICIKQEQLESIVEVEQSRIKAEVSSDEESNVAIAEESNEQSSKAEHAVEEQPGNSLESQQQMEDGLIRQHLPYNCDECSVTFENFLSMRRHMIDFHGQKYVKCCGVQYTSRHLLFEHVEAVFNPKAFKCDLCTRSFKSRLGYTKHKQLCHSKLFTCDQCPKQFPSKFQLKRHIENHTRFKSGIFTCETCGKCFHKYVLLKEHIDAVHEKNENFVCDICSESFTKKMMLKEHRLTHDYSPDQLKKQCPICKRWQKNVRLWKIHVDRHKGDGEQQCDQCDHVSINLSALKRHIERMHERKMDCPCDLCGKVYANQHTLREHVARAHTKEPLYQCRFCEKKFFSSPRMYTHRKAAHPKEWQEYITTKFGIDEAEAGEGASSK
nr:zinc finger protein 728-like [Aedes albopictus]